MQERYSPAGGQLVRFSARGPKGSKVCTAELKHAKECTEWEASSDEVEKSQSMSDVEESKSHSMVGRELEIPAIELTIGGVASTAFFSFRPSQ